MFLNLNDRVEFNLHQATALCLVEFPLKVERLYLRDDHGRLQRLMFREHLTHSWTYQVDRPESVMRGVTGLLAKGVANRERLWPMFFHKGVLSIQVEYVPQSFFSEKPARVWIGLWEDLYEDPNQMVFRFDPEEPNRFSVIG